MTFLNEKGEEETIQLGAYQTNFVTDGPECYSLCMQAEELCRIMKEWM